MYDYYYFCYKDGDKRGRYTRKPGDGCTTKEGDENTTKEMEKVNFYE